MLRAPGRSVECSLRKGERLIGGVLMTPLASRTRILCGAELPKEFRAEQIMCMPDVRRHRWTSAEVEQLVDSREGLARATSSCRASYW